MVLPGVDEVLVIGYGTTKKEDATGSVQAVTTDDFNRGAITSPQELVSGKIAGVQIEIVQTQDRSVRTAKLFKP